MRRVAIVSSAMEGAMALSVERGFRALGIHVKLVPYMDWLPQIAGFPGAGAVSRLGAKLSRPGLEMRLLRELWGFRPDLVLFLKSDDLHGPIYSGLRRLLPRVVLVGYHPDDPWNRATLTTRGPAHRRSGEQMKAVDAMFLWSKHLVERARSEGVNAHYLPFACDPALHPRFESVSEAEQRQLGAEVCFIGNWDAERERLLGPLADAGLGLAIWGAPYWRDRCRHAGLRRAWRGRELLGREQALATAASGVMVNVLRRQNKGACNMRTFEIPCQGGFMLHERSAETAAFFPAEVACGDFASPEELVAEARRWLADPDGRARVAEEGHRRALAWTYREWCEALLAAVEG
ncbi:MAG: glycosyltransferase [Deltaproteobacteria bacterium]|nr:glycosyltransferase [Deltaproteobacteria bacterium]